MTWWQGTWLVARRNVVENLRSRTFKVVTGLLLVLSVGAVALPQLVGQGGTAYTLVTVGEVAPSVRSSLEAAAQGGKFSVTFESRETADQVRLAVRDQQATAGLADGVLYTPSDTTGPFPALVAQAVVAAETTDRLAAAGLSPEEIASVQTVRPPELRPLSRVENEGRAGIGFGAGVALYVAIIFAGQAIATTVAMEKSTRISEVLLAVLRPTQIMVGTVFAVGLVTLAQLLIAATPFIVAALAGSGLGLTPVAVGDLGLAIVWFMLGFALYAFLFAATAALVDKVTEVSAATMPVSMVLVLMYVLAITIVVNGSRSLWSTVLSLFPLSAPVAMPMRWAGGEVPVYQLLLAMVLTAATAVLVVMLAASMYRRALVITGRRVKLREVLRPRTSR